MPKREYLHRTAGISNPVSFCVVCFRQRGRLILLHERGTGMILQVKNLTVVHKKDDKELIRDLSFRLCPGDRTAVIGEEGNGKSTLLQAIYDSAGVERYAEVSGQILVHGARIGYLAQEPERNFEKETVYAYCALSPGFYDLQPARLREIAGQLAVPADFFYSDQEVKTLSGGERVKLRMARLLMDEPDIWLLDEPSNDLDLAAVQWLERFIRNCRQPVLYVSHDELLLERTANMVIHLEQLRRKTQPRHTVVHMPYADYVSSRLHDMEHQEQVAGEERREYRKQQERLRQIEQKVEHRQRTISRQDPAGGRLLKKKMHVIKSQERRFEKEFSEFTQIPESEESIYIPFPGGEALPNGKKVCELEIPVLEVPGRVLAQNIRLRVTGPEKIGIVGHNGCGKSTLIRYLAGQLRERKDIRAAYMPQTYADGMDYEKTPIEFLTVNGDREENIRICTYLGSMKYTADEMSHPIGELSGGQKAKLYLLKLSMSGCNVMLLDEPTRNFSPLSNPVIRRELKRFSGAMISISHDRKFLEEVCDKVYELQKDGLHLLDKSTLQEEKYRV